MSRFIKIKDYIINTDEVYGIREVPASSECYKYGYTYYNAGIYVTMKNGDVFEIRVDTDNKKIAELKIDDWIDAITNSNKRRLQREEKRKYIEKQKYIEKREKLANMSEEKIKEDLSKLSIEQIDIIKSKKCIRCSDNIYFNKMCDYPDDCFFNCPAYYKFLMNNL
jgi:hypothetical protein